MDDDASRMEWDDAVPFWGYLRLLPNNNYFSTLSQHQHNRNINSLARAITKGAIPYVG